MKILCIHCGGEFSIKPEQLGSKGSCPHCQAEITLPKAHVDAPVQVPVRRSLFQILDGSISGLGSMIIHMAVLLLVALFQSHSGGGAGEGLTNDVLIGVLPSEHLTDQQEEQVSADDVKQTKSSDQPEEMVEVEPVTSAAEASAATSELSASTPSPSGGESGGFDLGSVRVGGGAMAGGGGNWDGMVKTLRRNGLDIVICFDSTGSMGGEIDQVKKQISKIATTLFKLVPKARISLVTYKDKEDKDVVRILQLTSNLQEMQSWLSKVEAGGGGDHPEAVDEGLSWAIKQNQFRSAARKVILIFGDAPPHSERNGNQESGQERCEKLAKSFKGQEKGIVSTVTCRNGKPMDEFYSIAMAGGGEAFISEDQREIMQQLMVLVFGSQHKDKVLEAFDLLEK
ncbi:MAG: VWA domain-containing protein [Pirellulaceae bacterium]